MKVLLPLDSPLRHPPAALDPIRKAAWDAVRFALDMTHVSYLKAPELEVHLRAIDAVEPLRNFIQHVAEKFRAEVLRNKPILGSLSWLWTPDEPMTGGFMMTITAGAAREGWVPLTNPGSRQFHRPIGLVTLSAFGKELDLTALVIRAVQIAKGLDQGARIAVGDSAKGGADVVLMVAFEFTTTASESTAV